jgi:superkiller protein 3
MRVTQVIKSNHEFYFGMAGVVFGIAGALLGILGFLTARSVDSREKRAKVAQYTAEAWDLIGGGTEGSTSFVVSSPQSEKDVDNLEKARRKLAASLDLDSKSSYTHYAMGVYLQAMGRYEESESFYKKAIKLAPKYSDPHVGLGALMQAQGNSSAALQEYRKALSINPKNSMAYFNIGQGYFDEGNYRDAVNAFRHATAIDEFDGYTYCRLGLALEYSDELVGAATAYSLSIELKPDEECLIGFGRVLIRLGEPEQAILCLHKAVAIAPISASAYYTLATALRHTGSKEDAQRAIQKGDEVASIRGQYISDAVLKALKSSG